ncbi:hypothetical protein [Ornithinimicrobium cavernae]|uniref:hypothetical protein n=1 Tax=Ornithinimicrobium cavernae TaxID=2666047 RepID=UPI000D69CE80|nr:hypothetical protein [Ornithinimicrobium cavernae]
MAVDRKHLRRGGVDMPWTATHATDPGARYGPWFQRRPGLTVVLGAVLFLTVTLGRIAAGDDASVGVTMLYALPVSLLAIAWGRVAGLVAGLVAITLQIVWVAGAQVDLSWLGWTSRAVPLLLIGLLLGDASERLARAERERSRQKAREQRHRQAVEINDSLIQGMAAAKWSLEAGRIETGLATLETTLDQGQSLVSQLIRDADELDAGR